MWYTIKTGDEKSYRGWRYSIYSNDGILKINISSPYSIRVTADSPKQAELRDLNFAVNMYNINRSHSFEISDRFLGIFVKITPDLEKGHRAARNYIDQNLGNFNFDSFYQDFEY
ncbi:hypothetical protein ACF3OC_12405 [Sphingobacterium cellulitidis]|uniref:hypothetical protein n=1 Tax=Sphingobacterium cellulitidis TaxID=1768011 RepID=UPI000B93B0C1|nr:hypothetical protein CHT99_19410 [Sphingobacterium cellulitidis]